MRELTDIEHRAMHDSMSRRGIANGLIVDYSAYANLQSDAALGKLNKKLTLIAKDGTKAELKPIETISVEQ